MLFVALPANQTCPPCSSFVRCCEQPREGLNNSIPRSSRGQALEFSDHDKTAGSGFEQHALAPQGRGHGKPE
jgi:hypothetical protein